MNASDSGQFKRQFVMVLATIVTLVYLSYRVLFTLNLVSPYAVFASLMLYIAECYGAFLMFLFFFQIWDTQNPAPAPPLPGRTVDVMIPTYNEDPQLLRGTISASLKIDYPHRTYVLDDGKRPEVKALCEELGATYITRPTNLHAKAGNLNHALEMTDGELVVIFDADHVAERQFIDRLIGYFADEKMGFVQTPHAFYNFDAYQGVLNYERGVYWEEGMLFYNVIQPGKNRWNGVSFCGSAAMFRRKALEEVGLIATQSITEDMHTGIRMHSKGWKSLFVNERMIAAIAAQDITSFNTQRLRWGEGNLGIFAFDNPLTMKGLTLAQRICYLGSMLSWTTGVQKLLIYITPMLMLLTDVAPVRSMSWTLAIITGTYLITIWTAVKIASNGYGWLLAIELTQMACFWTQVKSTWRAVFKRKKATFVVTSKRGRQSNSVLKAVTPQIFYIGGSTLAITWALTRYLLQLSTDLIGLTVGAALLIVHAYMAWIVIQRALRSKDRRASWRHPVALHVQYQAVNDRGAVVCGQCVTRDINEGGVGLVTFEPLPDSVELDLTISAAGQAVNCRGAIRSREKSVQLRSARGGNTQAFVYGIEFLEPTKEQLDVLWWLGAQYAVSLLYEHFKGGQFGLGSAESRRLSTHPDELIFELPFTLHSDDGRRFVGVTETLGPETMTAILASGFDSDEPARLEMATPFGPIEAWVKKEEVKSRILAGRTIGETRFEFRRFHSESRSTLHLALGYHSSKELASMIRSTPQRRRSESLRPAALVIGTTGAVAASVVGCVLFFEQDAVTIARINAGKSVTQSEIDQLAGMVEHAKEKPKGINEVQMLQLRNALAKLGRTTDVDTIDQIFANNTPLTFDGRVLKAGSLQHLHRDKEAERVFDDLLAQFDQISDSHTRHELLLAAARNAANLGEYQVSLERFDRLSKLEPLNEQVRLEYAGVLFRLKRTDDAIQMLREGTQTAQALQMLGAIYSSEKHFAQAIEAYQQAVKADPSDVRGWRGVADNLYWSQQFSAAAAAYREVLQRTPSDLQVEQLLAETLLYGKQYPAALAAYSTLLTREPNRSELWDNFLLAAAHVPTLGATDQQQLENIFQQGQHRDDEHFLTLLLNAMSKHAAPAKSLVLLKTLVQREPDNQTLRLQLADTLHQLKHYQEADVHYRWLIAHMQRTSMRGSRGAELESAR